ncbi:cytochrome P450 [Pseudonocardia pini]|uniref:cytochrome P450 n=1 Tax=Pseudonocardia pini TaxID=2758030 RepID=UPI0015F0FE2B|nr:cytochrome P450 [Pseudonocardia pini]
MTTDTTVTPTFDPFAPEVMADPLPFYRELRRNNPISYNATYDAWFLARFADVHEMLGKGDNQLVASEGARPSRETLETPNGGRPAFPATDPLTMHHMYPSPTYETIRQAESAPFKPGAVRTLAELIRTLVRERLDILVPRGRFDLTQHYGGIVAASVQCHLFRLPLSEAKYVLDLVNTGSMADPLTGRQDPERFDRVCELVEPGVRRRRAEGGGGAPWALVDRLLTTQVDERPLTDREIAMTIAAVLVGGTETVPKVVAHGLWELQRHPDQMAAVRADPAQTVPQAFREMVRYCGPAQWFVRTAHTDLRIGDAHIRKGQRVIYLLPSAARDEAEYGPDAEEFRWDRPIRRWVNFGYGQHFCLGYHLALLEGSILVEEFLRRVPEFEVIEERVVRHPSSFQWGFNELPIRVTGAGRA